MKNRLLLSGIVLSLLVLPSISFATTDDVEEVGAMKASTELETRNRGTQLEARMKAKAELDLRKKELEEKRESIKTEMEERRESLKKEIESRKEDVKQEISERKGEALNKIQDRLNKFTENVIERFEAAIERLETLAGRIDTRMAKMEAENIDVKNAKDLMVVAKLKIETAKTSLAGIDVQSGVIASSTATSTPAFKKDFEELKIQVEKAKKDIKDAHAALVDVINNLKPGLNKRATTTSATSTATTNTN